MSRSLCVSEPCPGLRDLDRYEKRTSVIEQAARQKLESVGPGSIMDLAFLRGDEAVCSGKSRLWPEHPTNPSYYAMASAQHSLAK